MTNKSGLWYPVQTLPKQRRKYNKNNKDNKDKQGQWYPIQTLGPKR